MFEWYTIVHYVGEDIYRYPTLIETTTLKKQMKHSREYNRQHSTK